MRWENSGVKNLNDIMDTATNNVLTFEKFKPLIKSNNFIRYYTIISNIPNILEISRIFSFCKEKMPTTFQIGEESFYSSYFEIGIKLL
jgi:hypothetical protein